MAVSLRDPLAALVASPPLVGHVGRPVCWGGVGGYLEVPVHHPVAVAVVDGLQDLLDTVGRVRLRVELSGHNILKQFATRHPVTARNGHPVTWSDGDLQ